jgi:ABC-type Zn uptake system ZnuABC Zn-binding protein ZnuA
MNLRPLAVLPAIALLAACSGSTASEEKLSIATTVSPLTSITATVAGDRASVTGIVPEGTNSHTFEPEPRVAELLSTADLIIVNGLKLEDPTVDLAERNKKPETEIVRLGDEAISPPEYIYDFSFPREDGKPNPHLWTDPQLAKKYADIVRSKLTALDPEGAADYQRNYDAFAASADALGVALGKDQATVPGGIKLVTYHDAYAYVAKDFGWKIVGAIQPKSFSEPTPAEVARLIGQVKAEGVPAIFGSEVFPSPILAEIAKESGAKYLDTLRDDDLPGAPGDPEHSWLALMRSNFVTIVEGLGGKATALRALDVGQPSENAEYPQ